MFAVGCITLVGNVFYMLGMALLRSGVDMLGLIIIGSLALAVIGAAIAGLTETKAKGW